MTFDSKIIEAKLALRTIGPEKMPALAWDALEAGHDGPSIRRVAALINPSGWEIDQLIPKFMEEAGLKVISPQEASIRLAKHFASKILSEGLDPLKYSRDFEVLWVRSDYADAIRDVGLLDDQVSNGQYMGQTEAEFREYARNVLRALTCDDLSQCL
jgi:hypothetical protein